MTFRHPLPLAGRARYRQRESRRGVFHEFSRSPKKRQLMLAQDNRSGSVIPQAHKAPADRQPDEELFGITPLVACHLVAGFFLAVFWRSLGEFVFVVILTLTVAQAALIGMWLGLGVARFDLRFAVALFGPPGLCILVSLLVGQDIIMVLLIPYGLIVYGLIVGPIASILGVLRNSRLKLRVVQLALAPPHSGRLRFGIRHVLLATALVAVVLGLGRAVRGSSNEHEVFGLFIVLAPGLMAVEFATLWAALAIGRPGFRLAIVLPAALMVGAIPVYYFAGPRQEIGAADPKALVVYSAFFVAQAFIIAASLLVVRSCGWRLVSGDYSQAELAAQAAAAEETLDLSGIRLPEGFVEAERRAVLSKAQKRYALRSPALWREFNGGMTGLMYRFAACVEHDEQFAALVKTDGLGLPQPERLYQEQELFEFFVSGQSALECLCYALYALGEMIRPESFDLFARGQQEAIGPAATRDAYERAFGGAPLSEKLALLVGSAEYAEWTRARNVLSRRVHPGREFSPEAGPLRFRLDGAAVEGASNVEGDRASWLKQPISHATTRAPREWLARQIRALLGETASWLDAVS